MVAIKIQSKEDIIGAYLCSLGFAGREHPSKLKNLARQQEIKKAHREQHVGKKERNMH